MPRRTMRTGDYIRDEFAKRSGLEAHGITVRLQEESIVVVFRGLTGDLRRYRVRMRV